MISNFQILNSVMNLVSNSDLFSKNNKIVYNVVKMDKINENEYFIKLSISKIDNYKAYFTLFEDDLKCFRQSKIYKPLIQEDGDASSVNEYITSIFVTFYLKNNGKDWIVSDANTQVDDIWSDGRNSIMVNDVTYQLSSDQKEIVQKLSEESLSDNIFDVIDEESLNGLKLDISFNTDKEIKNDDVERLKNMSRCFEISTEGFEDIRSRLKTSLSYLFVKDFEDDQIIEIVNDNGEEFSEEDESDEETLENKKIRKQMQQAINNGEAIFTPKLIEDVHDNLVEYKKSFEFSKSLLAEINNYDLKQTLRRQIIEELRLGESRFKDLLIKLKSEPSGLKHLPFKSFDEYSNDLVHSIIEELEYLTLVSNNLFLSTSLLIP